MAKIPGTRQPPEREPLRKPLPTPFDPVAWQADKAARAYRRARLDGMEMERSRLQQRARQKQRAVDAVQRLEKKLRTSPIPKSPPPYDDSPVEQSDSWD